MTSLQRHLQYQSLDERERQFYMSSLHHVSMSSGTHAELENWTITPYEIEFGPIIGSGGL
jgi:hypothetical protein